MSQSQKKNTNSALSADALNLSDEQLTQVKELQTTQGISFADAVDQLGLADPEVMAKSLAKHNSVPYLDLSQFNPDPNVVKLVSPAFCRRHGLIPVSQVGEKCLVVAFSDPSNLSVKDDLASVTQMTIQTVIASKTKIQEAIDESYKPKDNTSNFAQELEEENQEQTQEQEENVSYVDAADNETDATVVKFVNAILNEAIQTKASDIHIEVYEKKCRVRYRIDGKLQEKLHPPKTAASAIASRIKIMSKLDIAEKRRPQDGRLKVKRSTGQEVDFRVSVVPVLFGEKIVMRLLDQSNLIADLDDLHLSDRELNLIKKNITKPQGMVLMTGPTGSGKTTTIYSILNEINAKDINISTAEDPVEYNVTGINQVQVNSDIGFDFAAALRSFLRQDPDVVMVGEIRDLETAEIAFKAASTGHLVVSTLHTNDSVATVTRLVDIGIAPYIVSEVVSLVIAQRLVRKNCTHCSEKISIPDETLLELGVPEDQLGQYTETMKGEGCKKCNNSGFKGRMPIFEILEMTYDLQKAIIEEESNARLKKIAVESGLTSLRASALKRLRQGMTTVEEVVNSSIRDEDEH